MDLSIAVSIGSVGTAIAALLFNAYFRSSKEKKDNEAAIVDRAVDQVQIRCAANMAECAEHRLEADQRLHKRCDDMVERTHVQIMEVSLDLAEIKGTLRNLTDSMNGGLEARLARAVKEALR